MSRLEDRFMETVPYYLGEIAKQLKIANKLKALELKARPHEYNVDEKDVDSIIET